MSRICNIVFWLTMILWIGALMSAAIAAMNTFPTLRDMSDLRLRDFAALEAMSEDADGQTRNEHGLIAAGMVMQGVFRTVNAIQLVMAPVAFLSLIGLHLTSPHIRRRWPHVTRLVLVGIAAAAFLWHGLVQFPRMTTALHGYWDATRAGDLSLADERRAAFDADHITADAILRVNLVLLLAAASASALLMPARTTRIE